MQSRFSALAAAIALALGTSAANAGIDDMFSIRGYGTLGGLYSTQDEGDYVHDLYAQKKGVGRSDSVSAEIDSRTALQLDARFTDRFSAVVQIVSEAVANNSWDNEPNEMWYPSLEWANLSYRVTDDFTVRAGRIVMPFLMSAEFQKVGYANHWMRTPNEVYGKIPYTSLDGGELSFKHKIGSGTNTLRGYYGTQEGWREAPLPTFEATMFGVIDSYEIGSLTVRASFADFAVTSPNSNGASAAQVRALAAMFASAGGTAAAEALNTLAKAQTPGNETKLKYYALGANYDTGKWFAMTEVFKATAESKLSTEHTSGYVSAGVRVDKWTPYATYSLTETKAFAGYIPTAGLPAPLAAVAGGINRSLDFVADYSQDQSTLSAGVRWDVMSNIAVKAQYDLIMLPGDSTGMFINRTSEFEAGKNVSLFGLSVDFVF